MNVIVIGLGAMGSAAAQQLAERGCHVRGFDLFAPPHTHGSSHGLTRIFRQAYFEDHRYVPLLIRSFDLWQKLEADSGERLLHLPGTLVIGPRNGQLVGKSAASAVQFALPHELLDAKELKRRYPVFDIKQNTHGLLERNAGYLLAEKCVEQQLRLAARSGAELHTTEPVLDWHAEKHGSSVSVRTAKETYSADHLVVTAGPWAPHVLAKLELPLHTTRQVVFWFSPTESLDHFREHRLPVYLFEAEADDELTLYGFPLTGSDAEGIKVALHGSKELCTPGTICRDIRPSDEQAIRKRIAKTIPSLTGRMLRAQTCLYTMTPDEHFLLGTLPDNPTVTIAAGFSGHGFKFAPVIGEIMADLVFRGSTEWALDLFSLTRFRKI
ncbi:MAG: N-methyl-L-tryptophan oxidase [Acidobacteriota bacterium]|nr:N-methyl-L-tryptophan oxidase [Acidobacteriota bacterium]